MDDIQTYTSIVQGDTAGRIATAIARKAMDVERQKAEGLIEMLAAAAEPIEPGRLDVMA